MFLATFPNASRFIQNTPLRAIISNSQSLLGVWKYEKDGLLFDMLHLQSSLLFVEYFSTTATVVVEVFLVKTCLCVRASSPGVV